MTLEELDEIAFCVQAGIELSADSLHRLITALRQAWAELATLRLVRETEAVGGYVWEGGYEAGRKAEREEIAQMLERDSGDWGYYDKIAEAIRARGK